MTSTRSLLSPLLALLAAFFLSNCVNSQVPQPPAPQGPAPARPLVAPPPAPSIPRATTQLITAVGKDWASPRAQLQLWERDAQGSWRPVFPAKIPVLLGRNGMGWGRGLLTSPLGGQPVKREGDGRAPAGAFAIGNILGNDPAPPAGTLTPYKQVGAYDAWIDDVKHPLYNQHVVVDPKNVPAWFKGQKMREGDFAYRWLIDIRHNRDRIQPGAGSAIFFHVRRGPDRFTSGCTTMEEAKLAQLVRWLRPASKPVYVLLPAAEYQRLRGAWGLP